MSTVSIEKYRKEPVQETTFELASYAEYVAVDIAAEIVDILLDEEGIDITSDVDTAYDLLHVIESVRGLILKKMKLPHPVHEVSEDMFKGDERSKEIVMKLFYGEET